jgi:hypothetical protein
MWTNKEEKELPERKEEILAHGHVSWTGEKIRITR